MSSKLRRVLLIAAALVCVAMWWTLPRLKLSAEQKEYPLGMTLQEAKLQFREPYFMSTNAGVAFAEAAPQQQKEIRPLNFVIAKKEGLYLEFNHHEKLMKLELLQTHK